MGTETIFRWRVVWLLCMPKKYCNWTLIVQLIVEHVFICFFLIRSVDVFMSWTVLWCYSRFMTFGVCCMEGRPVWAREHCRGAVSLTTQRTQRNARPCVKITQATHATQLESWTHVLISRKQRKVWPITWRRLTWLVTARAQIGLSPLPVQPCWAIQLNLAGLEVVMKWFKVVVVHWTNWIRLFRRAYEKVSLTQSVCLSFSAATLFSQKNKQNSNFEFCTL